MNQRYDVLVVGGGILGLAVAYDFQSRFPDRRAIVLEKEHEVALHQTGRNSGVLHSGIYYKPGSLKAATCRLGKQRMERFCDAEGVPYEICGKVIVATANDEIPRLDALLDRGKANGVCCELIDRTRLRDLEPHCAGIAAIHVPETGIVDFVAVCRRLAQRIRERGGDVITSARVDSIVETGDGIVVQSGAGEFRARCAVNCAGLYSDHVLRLAGGTPDVKIVPFRGEYFELTPEARPLCANLIYPVPDPAFPFLGVHFTRMTTGHVECGPNAVFALAREGYSKTTIRPAELWESLTFPGFRRMAARHWRMGMGEVWRSLNKRAFVKALQRLVPEIRSEHLVSAPAGVRAQALTREGALVDDFAIVEQPRMVHVINAPSPAATASLAIGEQIVDRLAAKL